MISDGEGEDAMATLQDTREQEAWWDQLMAELHALEERVH